MKRKKILVIGTSDNVGGAARVGWDIAKGVKKYGYDSKFIVSYKKSNSSDVYELKRHNIVFGIKSEKLYNLISLLRSARSYFLADDIDFGASHEILDHPWYKEADIVQIHNLHGDYFKLETLRKIASEKPTVWTLHDRWALTAHCAHCNECGNLNNGNHFTPGYKHQYPMLWNNSNYLWNKKKSVYDNSKRMFIVTPSVWLANIVKSSILKEKPLSVINNGIDTDVFKPQNKNTIRRKLNLPVNKKIVAYVGQWGTIDSKKGGEYFLKIAKNLNNNKEIVFLCIGGTTAKEKVIKDNINYLPFNINNTTLSLYYNACDVLLFCSLAENFPLVTLEAMSCGLPVVSFDVGGVKEQVSNKINGYIAKYKDVEDLLYGLRYILTLDPVELKNMCSVNREKVINKYSLKKMAFDYASLYEKIV